MDDTIELQPALDELVELLFVKRCPLAHSAIRRELANLENASDDGSVRLYLAIWFSIGQIHASLVEQDDAVRDRDAKSGNPQRMSGYSESAKYRVERNLKDVFASFSDISGQIEFVPDRLTRSIEECTRIAWSEEWRIAAHKRENLADFLSGKTRSLDRAESRLAHRAYHLLKAYRNPTTHVEDDAYDPSREFSLTPRGIHAFASGVAELFELAKDFAAKRR